VLFRSHPWVIGWQPSYVVEAQVYAKYIEQQKLCIARLLPLKPEIILMDEPCSALDVEGTRAIEELMFSLKGRYTILIVTHNMAQARRSSDESIFMLMGEVIEHSRTEDLFLTPKNPKTAEYIEGRYG